MTAVVYDPELDTIEDSLEKIVNAIKEGYASKANNSN